MIRVGLLDRLFGVDLRSLAAFRIAAGAIVCVDVVTRLPFLTEFYTRHGPVFLSPYESLFALVGEAWWPALLFALLFVAGALLCVGRWTRVANVVCWALLFDLQRRNPHVLDGGDKFLRLMLFWSLFLPLGARWSLDARRAARAGPGQAGDRVVSIASAALLLQPALIYFFSAILKWEHPMWREGTAAYYAVAQEIWARPFADWVAARPGPLTQGLTWATLAAEAFCPLLLFSPWRTSLARGIAMVSLIAMQVGFAVSLELFLFPFISTTAILPFLPGRFWERFVGARDCAAASTAPARTPAGRAAWQGVCAVALAVVLLLNLESVLPVRLLPAFARRAGETVVAQGWTMYDQVYKHDFHLVLHGLQKDGRRILMDDGGRAASFEPVERLRGNYRAKMYFERLPGLEWEPRMYCSWLRTQWNRDGERPAIDAVELDIVKRLNPLPGEAAVETTSQVTLWPPLDGSGADPLDAYR